MREEKAVEIRIRGMTNKQDCLNRNKRGIKEEKTVEIRKRNREKGRIGEV